MNLRARFPLYLQLIRWDRPAGWLLLLWPSLSALWIAADGWPGWHLLAVFVLGTILMRSAGCCINDVADREFDRHVKRTAQRPVTSGALSVNDALGLGAVLAFAAFLLVLSTNPATVLWSIPALAVTLLYPYAKRHVSMPQAVLGVAFSFGIPMAFAAVNGGPAGTVFSASAWAASARRRSPASTWSRSPTRSSPAHAGRPSPGRACKASAEPPARPSAPCRTTKGRESPCAGRSSPSLRPSLPESQPPLDHAAHPASIG